MTSRWKYIKGKMKFWREIALSRLHIQTDFAGYNSLIDYVKRYRLYTLDGDVAEIGAFMGAAPESSPSFSRSMGKMLLLSMFLTLPMIIL